MKRPLLISILFVAFLGMVFCREKQKETPNILLITIDTLRADHLSAYGYQRKISPNLDRLASEGLLFKNAFSVMPTTLPSHASLFFGTWPRVHGSTNNHTRISNKKLSFLPVLLKKQGYQTAAYLSIFHLADEFRPFGGFDVIDAPENARTADQTLEKAWKWVEKKNKFFMWVHLWDPHSPYSLHPEFMKNINPGFKDDFEKRHAFFAKPYAPDELKRMIDLYDNEIAYMDHWLGQFMDQLRKEKSFKNTLLIITSDHGETLDEFAESEHYAFDHGEYLVEHQIRVPMIIVSPDLKKPGEKISNTATLLDLYSTVLDAVRLPDSGHGNSLYPFIEGKTPNHPDPVVFLQRRTFKHPPRPFLAANQYGIRDRNFKLLLDLPDQKSVFLNNSDDLAVNAPPARLQTIMQKRLDQWLKTTAEFEKQTAESVSPDVAEKLRSLGYIQ